VRRGALQGCRQRGRGGRTRLKGYVPFFSKFIPSLDSSDAHISMIINLNTTYEYSNGLLSERSTHLHSPIFYTNYGLKSQLFPLLKISGQHVHILYFLTNRAYFAQKHNPLVHRQPNIITSV